MTQRTPAPIPPDLAAQILERAARIDADEHLDLSSLRSAATDAGIQPAAFDRALAEMIAARTQPPAPAEEPVRGDRLDIAAKVAGLGVAGATLAIAAVSIMVGDAPPEDAVLGAAIGAGGAMAAIIAYLVRRRR